MTEEHPAATARVQKEWLRRVEAEYRSAAITQHLTLWLIQIGASPDLIQDGLRIVQDELLHAELSHEVFRAAGGDAAPHIVRESLALPRMLHDPLELDVLRAAVDVFCLGETVAVPLFKELRQHCDVPVARKALDRILEDEVRHRDFGWTLLGWLLDLPGEKSYHQHIEVELPRMFTRLRRLYAPAAARTETEIADSERAWGLMATARYGDILSRAMTRNFVPFFAELGIDANEAWDQSEPPSVRPTR